MTFLTEHEYARILTAPANEVPRRNKHPLNIHHGNLYVYTGSSNSRTAETGGAFKQTGSINFIVDDEIYTKKWFSLYPSNNVKFFLWEITKNDFPELGKICHYRSTDPTATIRLRGSHVDKEADPEATEPSKMINEDTNDKEKIADNRSVLALEQLDKKDLKRKLIKYQTRCKDLRRTVKEQKAELDHLKIKLAKVEMSNVLLQNDHVRAATLVSTPTINVPQPMRSSDVPPVTRKETERPPISSIIPETVLERVRISINNKPQN